MPTVPGTFKTSSHLFGKTANDQEQRRAARASKRKFGRVFSTKAAAAGYLFQIILPPSMKWGYISVGKSASSSTLNYLFQAEYGCDMTAKIKPEHDINPAAALHMLVEYGIFSRALWQGMSAQDILSSKGPRERICVVRDPLARAVSGFRYLCQSHRRQSRWFARDRFRMNAVQGFDWDRHCDTPEGFELFLHYVAWQVETEGMDRVDGHWRGQKAFIKPEVFRPTIVGRMEDMSSYFKLLSDRLGTPLPAALPWENKQDTGAVDLQAYKPAQTLVRQIYAEDYEAFGY